MAGGYHRSPPGRSLGDRVGGPQPSPNPDPWVFLPAEAMPRPCWVEPVQERLPGVVLAWQQDPAGEWHALVVVELPARAVRPREPPSEQ